MVKLIIDGAGAVLGRLGSFVAKELLKGKNITLINCEKIIVSGKKTDFVEKIKQKRRMGRGSSLKGPKYIRQEDRLVKRIIRGMLPWDRKRGRDAYKRLYCIIGEGNLGGEELKSVKCFNHKKPKKYNSIKKVVEDLR